MLTNNVKHEANVCVVHKVCSKGIEHSLDGDIACSCKRERQILSGPNTLNDFGDWLWNGEKKKEESHMYCSQGYDDLHLIMDYIHSHREKPEHIQNGKKNPM